MSKKSYYDTGFDSSLPKFDKGYCFYFKTDENETSTLEILEKDEMILQAGFQIVYKSRFFSKKFERHYRFLLELLESIYGSGYPIEVAYANIMNFDNDKTVCYLSKLKMSGGMKSLALRVGNKKFWK